MNLFLQASVSSLVTSPAELVVLIATVILLALRSWIGVTGVELTRRGTHLLTYLTLSLVAVFFLLVIVRFKTLGG